MKYFKYILICLLFLFDLKIDALTFIKEDESSQRINNAKFLYKSVSGEEIGIANPVNSNSPKGGNNTEPTELASNGEYYIDFNMTSYEELYKLLTKDQMKVADKLVNVTYLDSIKNDIIPNFFLSYCNNKNEFVSYLRSSNGIIYDDGSLTKSINGYNFTFYSFIIIEESFTPLGLEKERMVLPILIYITYNVNDDGTLIFDTGRVKEYSNELIKYNSSIDYNKPAEVFDSINENSLYTNNCTTKPPIYTCSSDTSSCNPLSIVIDKTSTEDLTTLIELKTLINGMNKTTLQKKSENTVTVELNNKSKTALHNNVLTSVIPQDLDYVSGSADNDGEYNSQKRTITWKFDYVDSLSGFVFTYKVSVPDDVKDDTVYKVNSSLNSTSFNVPKVSNEASADLTTKDSDENPDTGDTRKLTLLCALALCFVALYIAVSKMNKKFN